MDPPEQALVEVGAAALAAPSAAVAGLDAGLAGQDLTDASLALYLARLHAAGLSPAVAAMAVAAVKFRFRLQGLASPAGPATDRVLAGLRREGKGRGRGQVDGMRFSEVDTAAAVAANDGGSVAGLRDGPLFRRVRRGGRVEGDPGRRLSVNAIRRIIRSRAAAAGIEGRVSGHSLRVGGAQSLAAGGASICRDADGGQVAVTGDAGPLCTGPVGSTGRRRSRPLRSRIKPGSTTPPSSPPKGGDPRPLVRFSR